MAENTLTTSRAAEIERSNHDIMEKTRDEVAEFVQRSLHMLPTSVGAYLCASLSSFSVRQCRIHGLLVADRDSSEGGAA